MTKNTSLLRCQGKHQGERKGECKGERKGECKGKSKGESKGKSKGERFFALTFTLISMFILALISPGRGGGFFALAPVWADGGLDGAISEQYGSTRGQDIDFDGWQAGGSCANTAERGDLLSLDAYSAPTTNQWFFAFVIDSSHDLNSTGGSYYGNGDSQLVGYILGIDAGTLNNQTIDLSTAGTWQRNVAFQGDYFIGMYPNGANSLSAVFYDSSRTAVANVTVNQSIVIAGTRRIVELSLSGTGVPAVLTDNSNIRLALFAVGNNDGTNVLDAVGDSLAANCEAGKLTVASSQMLETGPYCKSSGRPTDAVAGINRYCTSNPPRDTTTALGGNLTCATSSLGITVDGAVDAEYTQLVESYFAGPYQGGSSSTSDFDGESSAYQYYTGTSFSTGGAPGNLYDASANGSKKAGADIEGVYAHTDSHYLYLIVEGPGALGGAGSMAGEPNDRANLYIALDTPEVTSATDTGTQAAGETPNHPASRRINFKGWAPDYVVEVVWAGGNTQTDNVNLYQAGWSTVGTFQTTLSTDTNPLVSTVNRYFGRQAYGADGDRKGRWEVAIPWSSIGGRPGTTEAIRVGIYTTGDSNLEANQDAWDTFDQSPGVGQGCSGTACHERLGDDPGDGDSSTQSGDESDVTPYSGQTDPSTNYEPASDRATRDVDTIEEYYIFQPDANLTPCDDFGDLPSSYPTLLANSGAYHVISNGLYLGAGVDVENNGQPSAGADGDDATDDEDGVVYQAGVGGSESASPNPLGWADGTVAAKKGGSLQLTITGSGIPQVFIDFNDGNGLTEVTLRDNTGAALTGALTGVQRVYFDIPDGTFPGSGGAVNLAVRVRLSSAGGLAASGPAPDGEIEDYILGFTPTAVTLRRVHAASATPVSAAAPFLLPLAAFGLALAVFARNRARQG